MTAAHAYFAGNTVHIPFRVHVRPFYTQIWTRDIRDDIIETPCFPYTRVAFAAVVSNTYPRCVRDAAPRRMKTTPEAFKQKGRTNNPFPSFRSTELSLESVFSTTTRGKGGRTRTSTHSNESIGFSVSIYLYYFRSFYLFSPFEKLRPVPDNK